MKKPRNREPWDYRVDGKAGGLAPMLIAGAAGVIFAVLAADQLKPLPGKYLPVAVGFADLALVFFILAAVLAVRYFCFKVFIGKEGFYWQTNPWNGVYYLYTQVQSCEEKQVVRHRRRARGTVYAYCFTVVFANGDRRKVQFDKALHGWEFTVLKERMDGLGGGKG